MFIVRVSLVIIKNLKPIYDLMSFKISELLKARRQINIKGIIGVYNLFVFQVHDLIKCTIIICMFAFNEHKIVTTGQ